MGNFNFLAVKWPVLANLGEIAEKNLHNDPNTTLFKLRLFGEHLVKVIFAYERAQEPADGKQVTKVKKLFDNNIIPEKIYNFLTKIRKKGNDAAHEGYDSIQDANDLLRTTLLLSIWFFRTYEDDQFQPRSYIEPQKVDSSIELKKELDELTADYNYQLSTLKIELDKLRLKEDSTEETIIRRARSMVALSAIRMTEEDSQKLVGEQLSRLGWYCPTENYQEGARPREGINTAISKWPLNKKYTADYALFLGNKLVAYIDTKSQGRDLYSQLGRIIRNAKNVTYTGIESFVSQSNEINIPFVFAVNALLKMNSGIWFHDLRKNTNIPKLIKSWYTPLGLRELLRKDYDSAVMLLENEPIEYLGDTLGLRAYQLEAIKAVENTIQDGENNVLVNMATGTGKTKMAIGLIYRLIKSGIFNRVLFLVDRRSVGEQVASEFREARLEGNYTFTDIYEIQSLDTKKPKVTTKVHISTIQNIVQQLKNDLALSVDTYDCIVIDGLNWIGDFENGFSFIDSMFFNTLFEESDSPRIYMSAFEYFDASKIVLTSNIDNNLKYLFGDPVYLYTYQDAVRDGYLLDFNIIKLVPAGIEFNTYNFNAETENSDNDEYIRAVLCDLIKQINPFSNKKTIVFASTENQAELIVRALNELYSNQYECFEKDVISKITASTKNVSLQIKLFKNERFPNIAVTVDVLATGIDVPAVSNLVFFRKVKSRSLLSQMLGRGNRPCKELEKKYFNVYDAVGVFDGNDTKGLT
ncbi:DUF4145 domain-containing protein [Paenibacillus sp. LMG 31461]|uniref:DUF4145 domain-containing protein n=1 Tax=Paenibacillus plantarum TaxID=2654975 RepID=A0ABX1XGF6_9BACL|nr:DEAD/DEAH box helicase family protein [Paenibacillus plantarum]NOU67496.1 DUF4145 domain-containing protein [Paenibacillus plantarum]